MFGVVPNWLDEKNGKKSITKEKLIVDHLIKNIGSSGGNAQSQDTDIEEHKEKKKKKSSKD